MKEHNGVCVVKASTSMPHTDRLQLMMWCCCSHYAVRSALHACSVSIWTTQALGGVKKVTLPFAGM